MNVANLTYQLRMLVENISSDTSDNTDIDKYLQKLSSTEKELMQGVIIVTKQWLVMPATNSPREISFSSLYYDPIIRNVGGVKCLPFLKHSNHWKRAPIMIFKGSGCFQFPEAVVSSTAK